MDSNKPIYDISLSTLIKIEQERQIKKRECKSQWEINILWRIFIFGQFICVFQRSDILNRICILSSM